MYINYYLIIKIIMNYVLIIILSISFGCTILYLINKYELRNKYIALQDLLSLTTQDVDEYMNTFNTQWTESTHGLDIIKQYVSSPKDYINKLPLKASDTVGSKTAIIYKILNLYMKFCICYTHVCVVVCIVNQLYAFCVVLCLCCCP